MQKCPKCGKEMKKSKATKVDHMLLVAYECPKCHVTVNEMEKKKR